MKYKALARQYPGKCAIVTGAGNGLGFGITEHLLKDGWKIIGIDINVKLLCSITVPGLYVYECDVADTEAYVKLLQAIIEKHEVDIIFNNAGVGEGTLFKNYSIENWSWIININLKAVLAGCHVLINHFDSKQRGMIVNIASAAGYSNLPKMSPYNVTKAAVISLSETLAHEVSGSNIRVKCVTPTFFRSDIMKHSKGEPDILESANKVVAGSGLCSHRAAERLLSRLHRSQDHIRFPISAHILFYTKQFLPSLFRFCVRMFLMK
ncbi:SDR family oxidoreductase [Cytophagaceae bacterium ABcell3]|nr:SDR family oxidoreductase [Cytophagaceae bacterium ABcell3]